MTALSPAQIMSVLVATTAARSLGFPVTVFRLLWPILQGPAGRQGSCIGTIDLASAGADAKCARLAVHQWTKSSKALVRRFSKYRDVTGGQPSGLEMQLPRFPTNKMPELQRVRQRRHRFPSYPSQCQCWSVEGLVWCRTNRKKHMLHPCLYVDTSDDTRLDERLLHARRLLAEKCTSVHVALPRQDVFTLPVFSQAFCTMLCEEVAALEESGTTSSLIPV